MIFFTNILPFIIIAASWITHCVMGMIWKKRDKKFISFLTENAHTILNGGSCEFMGFTYTKETRVVRFTCCISVVILTLCRSSAIVPSDRSGATKLLCILMTLFGGWWGIPWGPIRTVQTFSQIAKATEITLYDAYTRGVI